MEWIKGLQEVVPWLTSLPLIPKAIISAIVVGACLFILILIWTPPPETAISTILSQCYRRALFTRMHAQLSEEAMFASLGKCRDTLQQQILNIKSKNLQNVAVNLLAAIDGIERHKPISGPNEMDAINSLKLTALHAFGQLAAATGKTYPLPESGTLGESFYFTQAEADAPPTVADLQRGH